MDVPRISFAEFKKRLAMPLSSTKNVAVIKKIKDIIYLADMVDIRLDLEEK